MFYFLPASRRETRAVIGCKCLFTLCSAYYTAGHAADSIAKIVNNNGVDGQKSVSIITKCTEWPKSNDATYLRHFIYIFLSNMNYVVRRATV